MFLTVNYKANVDQNLAQISLSEDSGLLSVDLFRDRPGFHEDHHANTLIYDQLQQ